ncbi:MAG: type II toxin-antitoxin system VapC family toxin [Candidatus Brocadia sp.]|nr:type II toxin-antitoxin system VapC family toxin [Candidatus Brocadia sp.]
MKYLVDTDWIIDHFRGVELITRKLEHIAPQGVAISIISLAEIYEGVFAFKDPAKSQQLLNEFLAPDLKVLGINEDICKVFGRERTNLRKKEQLIGDPNKKAASSPIMSGVVGICIFLRQVIDRFLDIITSQILY